MVRAAIVEQVCLECGKRDRGYASARGNIIGVLLGAGFPVEPVMRAASEHSGVPVAPATFTPPPWPADFEAARCRDVGAYPVAFVRGSWRLGYADPEVAARSVRLGLPPHKPVLITPKKLDELFAAIDDDPFTPKATQVGVERTAIGDVIATEEQADAPENPPESVVAFDDGDDDDGEVLSVPDGAPVTQPQTATASPPQRDRAPRLTDDDDDDGDDDGFFVDRVVTSPSMKPAATVRPAAPTAARPAMTSGSPRAVAPASNATSAGPEARPPSPTTTTTAAPRPPPKPPSPPVRLKQPKPAAKAPAKLTASEIAPPAPSQVRQRALTGLAVACIAGAVAYAVFAEAPSDVAGAPPPALIAGKLDVTPTQRALLEQAAAAPTPDKAVALLSTAFDLDPTTDVSRVALVKRANALLELKRAGAVARDIEKLRRHPVPTAEAELKAMSDALAALTLTVPQRAPTPAPVPEPVRAP